MPASSSGHLCKLHQLWQAVILKPFKLEKCALHFWTPPIFISLVPTGQGYCCVLNTWKSVLKWIVSYGHLKTLTWISFKQEKLSRMCQHFYGLLHSLEKWFSTSENGYKAFFVALLKTIKDTLLAVLKSANSIVLAPNFCQFERLNLIEKHCLIQY